MSRPRLIVFASGTKDAGGSGFEGLRHAEEDGVLKAQIPAVISNHSSGGVWEKACRLGVSFEYFPGPYTAEYYQMFVDKYRADFVALSGWLKHVKGLNPQTTINIHPGPLPETAGLYGHAVHKKVIALCRAGQLTHTAICMHFVTEEYDAGPVFFRLKVKIRPDDDADSLGKRVNSWEHYFQPRITSMVVNRWIHWDGAHSASLRVPYPAYKIEQEAP